MLTRARSTTLPLVAKTNPILKEQSSMDTDNLPSTEETQSSVDDQVSKNPEETGTEESIKESQDDKRADADNSVDNQIKIQSDNNMQGETNNSLPAETPNSENAESSIVDLQPHSETRTSIDSSGSVNKTEYSVSESVLNDRNQTPGVAESLQDNTETNPVFPAIDNTEIPKDEVHEKSVADVMDIDIHEYTPDKQDEVVPLSTEVVDNAPAPNARSRVTISEEQEKSSSLPDVIAVSSNGEKPTNFLLNEDDLCSVAAFFSLPIDVLSSNRELFTSLMIKMHEFENIKSESQYYEVNYQQLQHSYKKKLESAKKELMSAKEEMLKLVTKNANMVDEKSRLEDRIKNISNSNAHNLKYIDELKAKLSELENSSHNTFVLLESKQAQLNNMSSEIKVLIEENKNNKQKVVEVENSKEELSNQIIQYKYDLNKIKRESQLANESRSWFETELNKKISELDAIRTQSNVQISSLKSKLMVTEQNLEVSQASYKNSFKEVKRLTSRCEDYATEIKQLKDKLSSQESQFMENIVKKDEHIQVLEKAVKDKSNRIESMDKLYKETKEKVEQDENGYRQKVDDLEKRLLEKDLRIEELQESVANITDDNLIGSESVHVSTLTQKSLESMGSQLSLTDLLSEMNDLKKEVVKEKRLKTKAEQELSNVLKELERKWPIMQSYKDSFDSFSLKEQKLNAVIANLTNEKSNLSKSLDILRKKIAESHLQINNLTKYKIDLQRQLVILLSEMQFKESGDRPLTLEEKQYINKIVGNYGEISNMDSSDTDRLITARLSTFRNAADLIKQNEKLLTVSRKLGEELESKDKEGTNMLEEAESGTIKKAKDAISKLQDKVKSLEAQLEAANNAKNILQNLFDTGVAKIGDQKDVETQSERNEKLIEELQTKKKELATIREKYDNKIFELNTKVQSVTSEKSKVELQLAKSVSSNELHSEKIKSLNSSIEFSKQENNQLKSMLEKAQASLSKLESSLQSTSDELVKAKSSIVESQIRVKTLSAERDAWKSVEDQLRQDINKLYNEKSESNKIIVQLQTLDGERQAHFKETLQRYNNSCSALQSEVDSLREKLEKSSAEVSNILHAKNVDAKVYQKRIDLLNEEMGALRANIVSKDKVIEGLREEVECLRKRHAAIDERKQNVLTAMAGSSDATDDVIVLREELKNALDDLEEMTKESRQYKELSTATEQQLTSLNDTYLQFKKVSQERIDSLSSEIESLSIKLKEYQNERDGLKMELEELKRSSEITAQESASKIKELNNSIATFASIKEDYEEKLRLVKSEVETKDQSIVGLNDLLKDKETQLTTYENINNILKNENDELKVRIQSFEANIVESKTLHENELKRLQESIANFEQELRNDKITISSLETQNRTLLNQLEESPISFGESDDMKNLITYLNREKDSLSQQLKYVKDEESILRHNLNMKEKEVNDLKSELIVVKEKSSTIDKYTNALSKMEKEVDELKVYKDNNKELRDQVKLYESRIDELEAQVSKANDQVIPLQTQIDQLVSQIKEKDQQLDELKTQADTFTSQDAQLEAKQKEINELKAKFSERTQFVERLRNEFNEKLKKMRGERQLAQDEAKELTTKLETLNQQLANSSSEAENKSGEEVERLKSQVRVLKEEIHQKNIEKETVSKSGAEQLAKLNEQLVALKKELEDTKSSVEKPKDLANLEAKYMKEKEDALKKLEAEYKSKQPGISPQEIEGFKKKLKAENDAKLAQEIEAHKNRIRAPTQAKINEIVERRVKAKTEELEKLYNGKLKELESKSSTESVDFSKEKEELLKQFETEKEELKKTIRAAVEKEKGFKEKFLQGKITRLEEQIKKLEKGASTSTMSSNTVSNFTPNANTNMQTLPSNMNMMPMPMNMNMMPNFNGQMGAFNPFKGVVNAATFVPGNNKTLPTKPGSKRNLETPEESDKRTKTE